MGCVAVTVSVTTTGFTGSYSISSCVATTGVGCTLSTTTGNGVGVTTMSVEGTKGGFTWRGVIIMGTEGTNGGKTIRGGEARSPRTDILIEWI